MYDLHTHSLLSDGELLPSELARRYEEKGYVAIAITDHVDTSNIKIVAPSIVEFCKKWPKGRIKVIPGIELTHIPLEHFSPLVKYARKNGIKVIVAHGETLAEPVITGTNMKALNSGIDILAHPGNITKQEVELAKNKGIFLEVTSRKMHKDANQHLVKIAGQAGARLIINSDSHSPCDILSAAQRRENAKEAGLSIVQIREIEQATKEFIDSLYA